MVKVQPVAPSQDARHCDVYVRPLLQMTGWYTSAHNAVQALLLPLLPPLLCMGCRDAWWCIGREAGRGDIARLLFAYCT